MTAQKADIVHHRILSGHPFRRYRTRIDAVGVEADAGHDVRSVFWRFEQWLRTANALKGRGRISKQYPGDARMQADEDRIRLERDGVRHSILAGGQVNRAVLSDSSSEHVGIVGCAVTLSAKRTDIDPRVEWRQIRDVGLGWLW